MEHHAAISPVFRTVNGAFVLPSPYVTLPTSTTATTAPVPASTAQDTTLLDKTRKRQLKRALKALTKRWIPPPPPPNHINLDALSLADLEALAVARYATQDKARMRELHKEALALWRIADSSANPPHTRPAACTCRHVHERTCGPTSCPLTQFARLACLAGVLGSR
ncbi:hypothetical protein BC830DRAFT_1113847 [Chytriomyces sp. MP71]|nr:hypothetical protein BC830DRAFT_1113847 [Chytriomyces sp. MP71]